MNEMKGREKNLLKKRREKDGCVSKRQAERVEGKKKSYGILKGNGRREKERVKEKKERAKEKCNS